MNASIQVLLPLFALQGQETFYDYSTAATHARSTFNSVCLQQQDNDIKGARKILWETLLAKSEENVVASSELQKLLRKSLMRVFFRQECVLNNLPSALDVTGRDHLCQLFYIQCLQQVGNWECGYLALFNVLALSQLINTSFIDCTVLNDKVRQLLNDIGIAHGPSNLVTFLQDAQIGEQPHADHLMAIASSHPSFGMSNVHILTYQLPGFAFYPSPEYQRRGINLDEHMHGLCVNYIAQDFRTQSNVEHYFICHQHTEDASSQKVTGHWIAIALIKLNNRQPIMIIMDSCNSDIAANSEISTYINFLYSSFIRPRA